MTKRRKSVDWGLGLCDGFQNYDFNGSNNSLKLTAITARLMASFQLK